MGRGPGLPRTATAVPGEDRVQANAKAAGGGAAEQTTVFQAGNAGRPARAGRKPRSPVMRP